MAHRAKGSEHGDTLNEAESARLRAMIDDLGEGEALERLGLSRHATYRAGAGLSVRRATARVIRDTLATWRAGRAA